MASSSPPLPDAAAKLLDFSQPFDVPLLDATVNAFYGAGSNDEVGGERKRRRRRRGERERKRTRECTVGIDEIDVSRFFSETFQSDPRSRAELSLLRVAVLPLTAGPRKYRRSTRAWHEKTRTRRTFNRERKRGTRA